MNDDNAQDPLIEAIGMEGIGRFVREVATHAGPGGVSKEDLRAALDELGDLLFQTTLWNAWTLGKVEFGWNADEKDLQVFPAMRTDAA